jgi:hypothetical protein
LYLDIYIFRRRVQLRQTPECLRGEVEPWRGLGGLGLVGFEKRVGGRTCVVKVEGLGPRGVVGERQRWGGRKA